MFFFFITDPRQARIEVGERLRQSLPESKRNEILDLIVKPKLQRGDDSAAIMDGASAIMRTIRGARSGRALSFGAWVVLIVLITIFVPVFCLFFRWFGWWEPISGKWIEGVPLSELLDFRFLRR